MIVGILIRNYKTYQGINFLPISAESKFCGILGENGVGKSSVLEALDSFFNGKNWNLNLSTKKSGLQKTNPYIVPVFLLDRDRIRGGAAKDVADRLHNVAVSTEESDVPTSNRYTFRVYRELLESIANRHDLDNHYVLPIGVDYKNVPSISIFNGPKAVETFSDFDGFSADGSSLTDDELGSFGCLLDYIRADLDYIYIPREIDPEHFTQLENAEIQVLMGETLHQILEDRVPATQITDINNVLNEFISGLTQELGDYSYRTPTVRQQNLRKNDVYNLIIEAFFNIRKLHKFQDGNWMEIGGLSSGEKQKAIIEVARNLLLHHREGGENLIMAIDEPESSLHMSACFDQFDSLFEISKSCAQVMFTSHWYGFLPTIESGSVSVITKSESEHKTDLIDLENYREQVRQMVSGSHGRLPYDIRLKSVNDFVQSVITSSIGDQPYVWIICEGSSERLYLSAYLRDVIQQGRVRIVPVGGAKEIKKIYRHLAISYEDFRDEVSGRIVLISDTDSQLVRYEALEYENLKCRRLVNDESVGQARLIKIDANPVSPETEIEDCLDSVIFKETLEELSEGVADLDFVSGLEVEEERNSYFGLDLRSSERRRIQEFLDHENNKFEFAVRYCKKVDAGSWMPEWINQIRGWVS
ncbi:AAA family ATPase [Guyparkeria sp.]|uniref:AAA family ATPase n=1 Tax=Guyparkeria sp. TaxID=2035736 RepID=UPI00397093D7